MEELLLDAVGVDEKVEGTGKVEETEVDSLDGDGVDTTELEEDSVEGVGVGVAVEETVVVSVEVETSVDSLEGVGVGVLDVLEERGLLEMVEWLLMLFDVETWILLLFDVGTCNLLLFDVGTCTLLLFDVGTCTLLLFVAVPWRFEVVFTVE